MRRFAAAILFGLLGLLAGPAFAHKASDAYLQMTRTGDGLALRWDIALRDLDVLLQLDRDDDQRLSWGEVRSRLDDIRAYALAHLRLQQGACAPADAQPPAIEKRVDGAYLVLQMQARCEPGASLAIDYSLFREIDPTHRGLLRVETGAGTAPVLRSLDPMAGPVAVALPRRDGDAVATSAAAVAAPDSASFFRDGIHHILIGYDHILFLLCLLLPAVLQRRAGGWVAVDGWRQAVWPMVGIVTMFTLGHSITLALAGLKWVSLSPRVIEPAIALTIIVAALDNLVPLLRGRRRVFAFLFGLIHGFGFAGVLGELELPAGSFVTALLAFNLGVEAGQLLIVTLALSALLALRHWSAYKAVVLRTGSVFAVAVATLWFVERVFDLKWLPV
ncbi:HupE/UreJ family protein [Variovorax sp. KK3]|uniref:HupE/UreJ family protein n=1 Tax=Variovorax sp. KK3 TaxID=1855728 RepID=UPI00097CBED7|nr:HupE/UreJ family protein [Variovorax sp. KK3]